MNLVWDIVLRKYVFSRLKADTFFSRPHVLPGKVKNILRYSVMLGYIVRSISFKVADAVVGTVLGSCRSHFLCHKVILASRLKGDRGQRIFMECGKPVKGRHPCFLVSCFFFFCDAIASIDGTANRINKKINECQNYLTFEIQLAVYSDRFP